MTAKILVVDDEPHFELIVRQTFRRQINDGSLSFEFAFNGLEALEKLKADPKIEAVLSDINMPEMDGLTLLEKINAQYPAIKTVVITAYADISNIRAAMNSGAFDFLVKPIALEDLRKTLAKTLSLTRQLRELEAARREREHAQKELVDHLQKMDQLKDEFLANITHELNTPLNGIIGIAESLADGAAGKLSGQVKTNISMLAASGRRLSSLVHDILDFSKLKNSDLKMELRPVRINDAVSMVLELSRPLAADKPLVLKNKLSPDLPPVMADENRLQQIFHNLIGNAVKFTERGSVSISARIDGDLLGVTVADTGVGIPEQKQETIFNSFEQLDSSETRKYGGAGLGLAITRKLLALHHGKIEVESEEGKGSRFTIWLPICQGESPPAPADTAPNRLINWRGETGENLTVMPKPAHGKAIFRILVADDEPVNRQVLANHFALEDYQVDAVSNGLAAMQAIESDTEYDLLLLDLMMPGMSGYEVCRRIRRAYSLIELPVLILTAKNQPRDFLAGLEAGANDYLAKPFDKRELLARAKTLLTLKQAFSEVIGHERRLAAERQNREVADTLRKLMETLTSTLNMSEVLNRFLESLAAVAPYSRATICLLRNGELTAAAVRDQRGRSLEPLSGATAFHARMLARITRERGPVAIADPRDEPDADAFVKDGVRTMLAAPFFAHGSVSGFALLERKDPAGFNEQEIQLAFAFAGQASIAVENAHLFGKVQSMAITDELTGLNNRRHFFDLANAEFKRATRYGHALAAIMIDIDRFKAVNDNYGHGIGDQVLRTVAQRILKACREGDILGRYGGEEFVALLPDAGQRRALDAAERLRAEVADTPVDTERGPLKIAISLGAAVLTSSIANLDALLKQADQALYAAKAAGRNRVVAYVDIAPTEMGPE